MAVFRKSGLYLIASLALTLAMTLMGSALTAYAQAKKPVFVELFTSQGCSSCPPADALLGELVKHQDVIALTFPVDYWDYLGWKDTLASPANSRRQYSYAKTRRDGQVYTPQIVLNGREHVIGNKRAHVLRKIAEMSKAKNFAHVPVTLTALKDVIKIDTGRSPAGLASQQASVWLIMFKKKVTIPIKHGENRGRSISYFNVVRQMLPLGRWTGKPMQITLPKAKLIAQGYDGCVALIQVNNGGPILGVAAIDNWQASN
jgi:hypothetical protein